jgi:exopolysaccharide biosynthesis operon protein EpsL
VLAALDPTDVIQIQATGSLVHDNNLFRLPDGVDSRLFGIDPDDTSDTTRILGVGLRLDKTISRQRFVGNVNLNDVTYNKNKNLDHTAGDGRLAWLWQVGNYWSGEASYRKRRSLGGFGDFRQSVKDLIDTETYTLSAGYQFHPRWRISGTYYDLDSEHGASTRRALNYDARSGTILLTYKTPAENSIGLQARSTDRNYPNRTVVGAGGARIADTGHTESRVELTSHWRYSGALTFDGSLGHVKVDNDTFSQRDFSGVTWKAAAIWEPTGKLRFNLNGTKDVRVYEDVAASYLVVNAIGLSPIYAVTSKITLQGDLNYEKRDYRGDPGFVLGVREREDKLRIARLTLGYTPIRNIDLSLSYEYGDRRSNTAFNDFDYQSWFATIRVGF